MTEHEYEAVGTTHPGDRVLRVYRKPKKTLPAPRLSTVLQVSKRVALETPFLAMLPVIAVLLLAFSTGLYFAEVHATGSGIGSYGDALWDGVVLMTTAGTMTEPVTTEPVDRAKFRVALLVLATRGSMATMLTPSFRVRA